ncbi:hypothetical protein HY949_05640, partial [Candidatus Gottesmanbacteria bacterium]|nr:hypothetical protein [Candidatus Gottesmanbacteria bacterium]
NRIFNFGSGKAITVQNLIKTIGTIMELEITIVRDKDGREGEITDQYVSWEKASRVLGWNPRVSLDEGLRRTIAWYRDYLYTTNL